VTNFSLQIQTSVDEFRKQKAAQQKSTEKYHKLVQEAEAAIKARDTAFLETEANKEHAEKDEKAGSFMNRSFNKVKMLAKITPEDNKRRLVDRCKELVREIEQVEHQLSTNAIRLKSQQAEFIEEIGRSLCELRELEENRLQFLKESLTKLCLAENFYADRMNESFVVSAAQVSSFNPEAEVTGLITGIEAHAGELSAHLQSSSEQLENCADLFPPVDKLLESIEYVRSTLQRLNFGLLEVVEAEKVYCKSLQRLLDKHANAKSGGNRRASTAAAMGMGSTGAVSVGDTLAAVESPSTRAAWDHFVQSLSLRLEIHVGSTELFTDKVCAPLESIISGLHNGRREISDRRVSNAKCLDAAQSNVTKLSAKLAKLQQQLRERRSTVRKAKEDLGNETSSAAMNIAELDDDDIEGSSPPDRVSVLEGTELGSSTGKSGAASMMKSLEKMRTTKLSLVVGLETKTDRISRIDTQITTLEEEEEELTLAHSSAAVALTVSNEESRKELLASISEAKDLLYKFTTCLKPSVFEIFVNWQQSAIEQFRKVAHDTQVSASGIEISKDVEHFVNTFVSQVEAGTTKDGMYTFTAPDIISSNDFAQVELFEKVVSHLVDEERQAGNHGKIINSGNFASVVSAAMAQQHGHPHNIDSVSPPGSNTETPVRSRSGSPSVSVEPSPISSHEVNRSDSPPLQSLDGTEASEIVKIEVIKKRETNGSLLGDKVVETAAVLSAADGVSDKSAGASTKASSESGSKPSATVMDSWGVAISDVYDSPKTVKLADFGVASTNTVDAVASPMLPPSFPNISSGSSAPASVVQGTLVSEILSGSATTTTAKVAEIRVSSSVATGNAVVSPAATENKKSAAISAPNELNGSFQTNASVPVPVQVPTVTRDNVASVRSSNVAPETDHELSKFGLSASDRVLESFSCALYPKKGLGLTHGRMYITQYFLAFQGWPETRLLIPLSSLVGIDKMNTVGFIPNAILVKVENDQFFFGSFLDRDQCFQLLKSMSEVVKRMVEIHGKDVSTESRNLVIGMQKDALGDMMGSSSAVKSPDAGVSDSGTPETGMLSVVSPPAASFSSVGTPTSVAGDGKATSLSQKSALVPVQLPVPVVELPDEPNDGINIGNTYTKNSIHMLAKDTTRNCAADEAWKACWLHSAGFR
jgi:hypothetical protein